MVRVVVTTTTEKKKKNDRMNRMIIVVGMTVFTLLFMEVWYNKHIIPDDYYLVFFNITSTTTTPQSSSVADEEDKAKSYRSLKEWRQKCKNAKSVSDYERIMSMHPQIFTMPPRNVEDDIPAEQTRNPADGTAVRRCEHVVMDFGANIGDSSAHVIDSGMVACCDRRGKPTANVTRFNVKTKQFEVASKLNPLAHQLAKMMEQHSGTANNTLGPEDYCYYGIEGNPVFTDRLQKVEDYVMAINPRPIRHMHFFTESVGAGQDGMTKLYLDTVNPGVNFWGSSIFAGHKDVRMSSGATADVMGYTIGTLMRKTLKAFDPDAKEEEKKGNHLFLKVDIEGGEYPMLDQAGNEDDTLCEFIRMGNTADLFMEFHSHTITGKHDYVDKMKRARKKLEGCGVNFRDLNAMWM